ncbi:MAG: DegT/DnrJ/EryC1/StrS family aminotransferase [Bacteroidia bacterium]|nr:DegT/DnrJ/EryC1/StrS family aminotransferase [Bacteroidia bacterium]
MKVPFVDLYAQYLSIKEEIDQAIAQTIKNTSFIGGKDAREFEAQFADYVGQKHCIAVGNGTDSLEILLQAYEIGPGDEVIVPVHTWISTAEVVSSAGAIPVFVDTDPDHYTIRVDEIEAKINERTKAIMPVHLFGMPADMDPIMELAKKHKLIVIEDAAQAHGATYKGKKVGNFGHAVSFSFYPGKNLGAYGDAGGILTNDDEIARRCRMIANHGQLSKHDHQMIGRNSRLDGMQGAILKAKLPYLDRWIALRQQHAQSYTELLSGIPGLKLPEVAKDCTHVWHLYVIQHEKRDEIKEKLKGKDISTGIHYPHPLSLVPAYAHLGYKKEDTPKAVDYLPRILSMPIYPEMTEEIINYVVTELKASLG